MTPACARVWPAYFSARKTAVVWALGAAEEALQKLQALRPDAILNVTTTYEVTAPVQTNSNN